MAVGARPLVPSRLAPARLGRNGIAHGTRRTPTTVLGGYVALTKPRIIELLLITTVPTMVLAERGWPSWSLVAITLLGGTLAAGGANAINMVIDRDIDADNPRTRERALPLGLLRPREVALLAAAGAAAFLLAAALLNRVALAFSIPVLAVLLGYSYSKRFTSGSHFILGLSLGIAPLGAWVAVKGDSFLEGAAFPLLMGAAVLFWTAGFDIVYACQDVAFDRGRGLRSVPARLGVRRSLVLSSCLHVLTVALLVAAGAVASLSFLYYSGVALVALLLVYGHAIVSEDDLSRLDVAFFTVNGWVSLSLMACTLLDVFLFR